MTRKELLQKLSSIKVIVANPVVTYDMGMQFDVLTSSGATTTFGNVGQWPYMSFRITESFRDIQQAVIAGKNVTDEEMMEDSICKELCTYHDMWNGSFLIEEESLSKCLCQIREALKTIDLSGEELFVYASVESWNIDIRFFSSYEAFKEAIAEEWDGSVESYESMDDEELQGWYDTAEENDWDGIPYSSFGNSD